MFRALIYPSSGVYDYAVELPHWRISLNDLQKTNAILCNTDRVVRSLHDLCYEEWHLFFGRSFNEINHCGSSTT